MYKSPIQYILAIIIIVILLYTYFYVSKLSYCPCFLSNKEQKLNLEYIKFYIILDLFITIIALFILFNQSNILKTNKDTYQFSLLSFISILFIIFIHGYLTYNVYYFYKSIRPFCECNEKWQKYIVYLEGISSGLLTLQYIFYILFTLLVLLFY